MCINKGTIEEYKHAHSKEYLTIALEKRSKVELGGGEGGAEIEARIVAWDLIIFIAAFRLGKAAANVPKTGKITGMAEANANQINEGSVPVVAASQNATINPKSPYCLSTFDHPGLLFVTNPFKENGENYFTWRRNMLNPLVAKNKAGFVNDFEPWVQCNAIVLSWITNALDKELQNGAAHARTANEVWANLQERLTQRLAPRVYELKRAIALLQQEKAPIATYYGRLKAVWNELQALNPVPVCTCGCTCGAAKKMQSMREEEKVFDFLMGLDESFGTVPSQVLSIDLLPTLGRAYAITAQEEKQKSVAADRSPLLESTALLSHRDTTSGKRGNGGAMNGERRIDQAR
ncbi:hypothetical protein RJ639_011830 [Escallonia herrerae]|uniref:Retrotransposon Copia-like N-terminal domain-containing protein n=1 Tax=Escallonia herrerae TaxID=1293975 RepID=A0AA88VK50_9ASTE|nr:hypothetical protein RJ639_011830 [Escallonia herrerae]